MADTIANTIDNTNHSVELMMLGTMSSMIEPWMNSFIIETWLQPPPASITCSLPPFLGNILGD